MGRQSPPAGARAVLVDQARVAVPICASAIRANPWAHWSYLPEVVRPYFLTASGRGQEPAQRALAPVRYR